MKHIPNAYPRFFWPSLVLFSLIGQIAWVVENMYLNVFIYNIFRANAEEIAAMVAASAIAATVTTLLIGALSDKLGKRKVFICGGYIAWGISILGFALLRVDLLSTLFPTLSALSLGVSLTIAFDCLMTFFGSSANDAAFNAWLTDATEGGNRGAAEAVNAIMPLIAMLAVFGSFMAVDLNDPDGWTVIFTVIGLTVLAVGLLGLFLLHEPARKARSEDTRYFANLIYGFRPSVVIKHPQFYLTLLVFTVFGISVQTFMPYLILYYEKTLAMTNYVLVLAPTILIAALATLFYGRLYDKKGYAASIVPAIACLLGGYLVLYVGRSTPAVVLGSLLLMCGNLFGGAVFGAMIRDRTPQGMAGRFQGLRIVAQVLIPGTVGPAISAAVLQNAETVTNSDGTQSFLPNANIFLAAAAVAVLLFALLFLHLALLRRENRR